MCTLWLAQWYIKAAKGRSDLAKAKEILLWTKKHALPSGMLAEQLDPIDGRPVSVSPLTWSHAAFVETVNKYLEKYKLLAA